MPSRGRVFRADIEAAVLTPDELNKSSAGRKPFDAILMFRILALQALNNLSESVGHSIPDASTLWLLRENLTKAGLIEKLFDRFEIRPIAIIANPISRLWPPGGCCRLQRGDGLCTPHLCRRGPPSLSASGGAVAYLSILMYGLGRALLMAHRRLMDDDPIVFALRDWNSYIAPGLIGLILIGAR